MIRKEEQHPLDPTAQKCQSPFTECKWHQYCSTATDRLDVPDVYPRNVYPLIITDYGAATAMLDTW